MVKSLLELCTAVCIKNIRDITDVGTVPYAALRPTLLRLDNPEQLRVLEMASPHLEEDDAELWMKFIERDFPVLVKRHHFEPRNPASWHKVYFKYKQIEEENKAAAEEKLKSAFAGIRKNKETNVSKIVDYDRRKLPSLPREGRAPMGRGRRGGGVTDDADLRFSGGSRTKTNNAKNIMKKARREAKEIHMRNRLATPTGLLPVQRGQIAKAPQSMVDELRVKSQPKVLAPSSKLQVPKGGARPPRQLAMQRDRDLEDREARLRKMKGTGSSAAKTTYLDDSELEDYNPDQYSEAECDDYNGGGGGLDADDLEDMFGDEEEEAPPRASHQSSSTPKKTTYSPTKPAANGSVPYRRSGLLSNAPGSSRGQTITRKPAADSTAAASSSSSLRNNSHSTSRHVSPPPPPSRPAASSPPAATSPPLKPQVSGGDGRPMMVKKRKPVDVFMKAKPKVQRR